MKTLALRIYLTVVAVLLVFALITGWLAQRNLEHERTQFHSQTALAERVAAWGELLENSLPPVTAPRAEQAQAFLMWAERLRMPMALDDPQGQRLAMAPVLQERLQRHPEAVDALRQVKLSDGRTLWVMLRVVPVLKDRGVTPFERGFDGPGGPNGSMGPGAPMMGEPPRRGDGGPPPELSAAEASSSFRPDRRPSPLAVPPPWLYPLVGVVPPWLIQGVPALVLSLVLLFVAVAIGAWPVATHLTRRLTALRQGVERFGTGQLQHRVAVEGRDEVAALASSFNEAAQRIEDLITANRSLLANASHELRSPLARLKMAVSLMADLPPERAAQMREEIHQDIRELDALVEEVLLASRLDAKAQIQCSPVDLIGLGSEEAARVGAQVDIRPGFPTQPYQGDERLLRRAVRNLLENAKRYGGSDIELALAMQANRLQLRIMDRGPGVPEDLRERIFEPFYRLPGHAEHAGGVGLGLSLVRQIAQRHGGDVRCEGREGGGSCFVIELPHPSVVTG